MVSDTNIAIDDFTIIITSYSDYRKYIMSKSQQNTILLNQYSKLFKLH
jgi:hypothetical protein